MDDSCQISSENFLTDAKGDAVQAIVKANTGRIQYSPRYRDDANEYRHVILPKDLSRILPKGKLMAEGEWRSIGVQQSLGWEHYLIYRPEPHVLCFRRPIGFQAPTITFAAARP